jgi:hypothetical protein
MPNAAAAAISNRMSFFPIAVVLPLCLRPTNRGDALSILRPALLVALLGWRDLLLFAKHLLSAARTPVIKAKVSSGNGCYKMCKARGRPASRRIASPSRCLLRATSPGAVMTVSHAQQGLHARPQVAGLSPIKRQR